MPQTNSIYVAGEWRQGAATVENRNPSDLSDLIGDYGQASAADLDDALAAARAAQPIWARAGCKSGTMF